MLRLLSTIRKDLLVLLRDRSGLAVIFLMPAALIIIMALIQDAPFKDYQEVKIPLLLVNQDKGVLGKQIEDSLKASRLFEVTNSPLSESEAKAFVANGDFKVGIIVPEGLSARLNRDVKHFLSKVYASTGGKDSVITADSVALPPSTIQFYFATDIKKAYKNSVLSSMKQFTSRMEMQSLIAQVQKEFNQPEEERAAKPDNFISIEERNAIDVPGENLQLNSVQHNVPAWTMFGMFFIVISLGASVIKEREDGIYFRLRTLPGNYFTFMAGKVVSYLIICLIQCFLMLMIGIYFLPVMGLPKLIIGTNIPAIMALATACGLAATGYGMLIGTFFNTHQQTSTFGAISVVILAALGGIWVPVYVMPDSIRGLAELSPLYWGLSGFHELFLRYGTVATIYIYLLKLTVFFLGTIIVAYFINKFKNN
jgi:ABC-2 type transport system permease protein